MRHEKSVRNRGFAIIIVMGALVLGLVSACSLFNQIPVARIAANVVSGTSPLAVTFDASNSVDGDGIITSYTWDFGDGDSDMGVTPVHTFVTVEAVEVFTVTLTVTDEDGASATATQTIEVRFDPGAPIGDGVPTARFTSSKFIGVDPLTVTFDASTSTAGSGTIVAYNWNFGDGGSATGLNPTHTFNPDPEVTTTFNVTLFVWNSNGQLDTAQLEVIVIVPEVDDDDAPEADIFVTGPDVIYGPTGENNQPIGTWLFEVKFDPRGSSADAGHSIDYYAWDFGDGDTQVETSDLEVTHIYELSALSRTYLARLTVFDDAGLEDTAIVNITLTQEVDEED